MKFGRLRSQSDVPRPLEEKKKNTGKNRVYTQSDAMLERSLSTPDLGVDSSLDLTALDRDAASLLACMCLEAAERSGDRYVQASAKDKPLPRSGPARITSRPPDYSLLAPLPPRYPILPREEEGAEKLPSYSPSVFREGILFRKPEMLTPFSAAPQRSWAIVHVELNNTQLNVYAANRKPRKNSGLEDDGRDYQVGTLLRSYTLQYAEVGAAVDYSKRPYVIRVRAESEQFLLECASQEDYIIWINVLQMAIDLALPLEERRFPNYRSIPRRRRRTEPSHSGSTSSVAEQGEGTNVIGRKLQTVKRLFNPPSRMTTTTTNESTTNDYASSTRPRSNTTPVMGNRFTNTFNRRSRHMSFTNNESTFTDSMSPIMRIDSSLSIGAASTVASSYNGSESVAESSGTSTTSASSINDSSSDNEAPLCSSNEAINEASSELPTPLVEEDEEDDDEYENDASRLGMDATFLESTPALGEKWQPGYNPPSYASYLRYAQRCLTSLYSHSSWTNKTIIREGRKYIVRQDCFEKISSTVKY
ncbi:hypothetical protein TRVA0_024S00694 [Trichomonascus vanleenenianus]|uniref:uncharacterized protein n=1 Tax=Trichomonascus vanleenenianus TaxID=2268995 RepID=UPI003EC96B22